MSQMNDSKTHYSSTLNYDKGLARALLTRSLSSMDMFPHLYFSLDFEKKLINKPGLFYKFRKKQVPMDIDLSCALFDNGGNLVDIIWYKKLRDTSETIIHHGDELHGRKPEQQENTNTNLELIELKLKEIPSTVHHIALMVNSFYKNSLNNIAKGQIKIEDDEGNDAFVLKLPNIEDGVHTMWLATLSREATDWRFSIQQSASIQTSIPELAQQISTAIKASLL